MVVGLRNSLTLSLLVPSTFPLFYPFYPLSPRCPGTHIPFSTSDPAFKNYKKYKSIVAQALVDHRLLIRDWCCGFPGSWSDKKVLNASSLSLWIKSLLGLGARVVCGVSVSYYILGDGIYSLAPTMMVPFEGEAAGGLNHGEQLWNYWQSSARMVGHEWMGG